MYEEGLFKILPNEILRKIHGISDDQTNAVEMSRLTDLYTSECICVFNKICRLNTKSLEFLTTV